MAADVLRLGFYVALLAGALSEIAAYQRRLAITATLDERRRVARDLHDGMAQELAFILQRSRRMAAAGDRRADELAQAAERAFDESRAAIAALRRRGDEPFAAELCEVAEQLTARAGARLRLEVDPDIDVEAERRNHLLRIVREAVSNGVRHGAATEIVLRLSNGNGLRLVVRDNGTGFEEHADGGYGLVGMRERVRVLGGQLDVRSHQGRGTEVEVVLP
jgi:signal transduction histidine kinase